MASTTADGVGGGRDHVVVFPFMAKGHTLPLLHFVTALSVHHRSLRVTVATTPANLAFVRGRVPSSVRLAVLPFPSLPPLPAGIESTDALPSPSLHPTFLRAAALLREPFAELLASLSSPPLVLVSDFFLGFTRHGMSCFSTALGKSAMMGPLPSCAGRHGNSFHVPRMPAHMKFTAAEVPPGALAKTTTDHEDPLAEEPDASSWGVLVNSFAELDEEFVAILESFYRPGARAWLVGPLFLLAAGDVLRREEEEDPEGCLPWLDEQPDEQVVYVSFGTQAHVADEQLGELARGLARSGHPFLWAVRSETWSLPADVGLGARGRVVRGGGAPEERAGAPRRGRVREPLRVELGDGEPGGGEARAGVADDGRAARERERHVADIIGAGIRIDVAVVGSAEVERKVRRLMDAGGEEGRGIRARAAWAQQAARSAVSDGGTSRVALLKLVEELQRSYDRP